MVTTVCVCVFVCVYVHTFFILILDDDGFCVEDGRDWHAELEALLEEGPFVLCVCVRERERERERVSVLVGKRKRRAFD